MSLILHLSDLHLGPVESDVALGDYKSEIVPLGERLKRQDLLKDTLQKLNEHVKQKEKRLDAIVITGDIAVKGSEEGFEKLEEMLACLADIRPKPHQVVVVPGNHDVAWAPPDYPAVRYRNFLSYIRGNGYITPLLEGIDLNGTRPQADKLQNHFLVGDNGEWAILPINSAHYCGKLEPIGNISEEIWATIPSTLVRTGSRLDEEELKRTFKKLRLHDIARISPEQFRAIEWLRAEINASARNGRAKPLVIAAMHHHLLPVTDAEELKSYESITNLGHLRHVLRHNDISVVLHGHKHIEYV
jgi:3',5'-cyclic AMP phosphodiesterase CpdA